MNQVQTIELYKADTGEIAIAALEVQGVKHFTGDVREGFTEITFCTSRGTLPNKFFNAEELERLTMLGLYKKETIEAPAMFVKDFYISYTYVQKDSIKILNPIT